MLKILENTLIVIVVYEQSLSDCQLFQILDEDSTGTKMNVFIYDNSRTKQPPSLKNRNLSLTYIHNKNNPGVSTAYNEGAAFARQNNLHWILLFDQDTIIPVDFVDAINSFSDILDEYELVCFPLRRDTKFLSPLRYHMKRGTYLSDVKLNCEVSLSFKSMLNSGILIKTSSFLEVGGYDVSVGLYFSDFVFINRLRKIISHFYLLPIILTHSMSSDDISNREAFKKRFFLYLKGAREAARSENALLIYLLLSFFRALKSSVKLFDVYPLALFYSIWFKKISSIENL